MSGFAKSTVGQTGCAVSKSFAATHLARSTRRSSGRRRLGQVVVHPGREAAFAVALHGVRRHGDDREVPAAAPSAFRIAAVASKPSMTGIWTSMRTRSNARSARDQASTACGRRPPDGRARASPGVGLATFWLMGLSSARRIEAPAGSRMRRIAGWRRSRVGSGRRSSQGDHDGVEAARTPDGLGEVAGDAERAAPADVAALAGARSA